jgi:hypothetical protein
MLESEFIAHRTGTGVPVDRDRPPEYLFGVAGRVPRAGSHVQRSAKIPARKGSQNWSPAMYRFAAFSFAVFLTSITLSAQSPRQTPEVYVIPAPADHGCPVSMHAQQRAGGDVLVTRDSQRHPLAQRIHLILGDFENPARVVAAKVTVRGTNGKPTAIPTSLRKGGAGEATKTLDLRFDVAENGEASTDMSLAGFTSVSSIRLDSLTFADGAIWVPASGQTCRTAPDPFMLVSSR